jgi:hypothetical protein
VQPAWEPYIQGENKITRIMLHGLTDKNVEELVPMAKCWSDPAKIEIKSDGFKSDGYDPEQMAYVINAVQIKENLELEFTLDGTKETPVINPVVVIKNWNNIESANPVHFKLRTADDD